jgi:hypothetical protein
MPDPKKKSAKRDLAKPLAESKFDPADYNRDGSVSPSEQRKYNRVQKLKQKGTESLKDKNSRRGKFAGAVLGAAGTVLTIAERAVKVAKDSKK